MNGCYRYTKMSASPSRFHLAALPISPNTISLCASDQIMPCLRRKKFENYARNP
jgi:hypothetical protein